jgi:hypothetical protein
MVAVELLQLRNLFKKRSERGGVPRYNPNIRNDQPQRRR